MACWVRDLGVRHRHQRGLAPQGWVSSPIDTQMPHVDDNLRPVFP